MNIFDMAQRGDKNLRLAGSVTLGKRIVDRHKYRGLDLHDGSSFVLSTLFRWHPFKESPRSTGWGVAILGGDPTVKVTLLDAGIVVAEDVYPPRVGIQEIRVPEAHPRQSLDLRVSVAGGIAFLLVHEVMERADITSLCRGRGVEIGPGPSPRIMPSDTVDVQYVEPSSAEHWTANYSRKAMVIDSSLWEKYILGTAAEIPVSDGSLDFIFSCHVFEHLANPLGHLERWKRKLKKGGFVAAIVPDMAGSKDYLCTPSTMDEFLQEYRDGGMVPTLNHYRRWVQMRGVGREPGALMAEGFSIHAHFYTRTNVAELLDFAVRTLGFTRHSTRFGVNHEEFHLQLWR